MRISDWSSDVCSSDLLPGAERAQRRLLLSRQAAGPFLLRPQGLRRPAPRGRRPDHHPDAALRHLRRGRALLQLPPRLPAPGAGLRPRPLSHLYGALRPDRKSVVKGEREYERVDSGGRRYIQHKNKTEIIEDKDNTDD